jgi:hypothetical protein
MLVHPLGRAQTSPLSSSTGFGCVAPLTTTVTIASALKATMAPQKSAASGDGKSIVSLE